MKGKRSRVVIDHILEHSFITTEDLEGKYGYKHPPRAVRDVREQGVPIETFKVKNAQGRTIAAYRFGDPSKIRRGRIGGRTAFSKEFKKRLVEEADSKCAVCLKEYDDRFLQIDHCIPYEVAGDSDDLESTEDYMLLCGSCNRAKSWSCEHCRNWLEIKNPEICQTCYWMNPISYDHIALQPIRRIDIVWSGDEVGVYDELMRIADNLSQPLPEYVKETLRRHLLKNGDE